MRKADLATFEVALTRLREVNALLDGTDAGVCFIHLDACIAALESRIRRHGMSASDQHAQAANDAASQLAEPIEDTRSG